MSKKCAIHIRNRVPSLTVDQAKNLADVVAFRARELRGARPETFRDVMRELTETLANEFMHTQRIEKRNAALNKRSQLRMEKQITNVFGDDLGAGLEAFLVGVESRRSGARRSVAASFETNQGTAVMSFASDLERRKVLHILRDKTFDEDVMVAAHAKSTAADTSGMNPDVVKAAEIVMRHTEAARLRANKAGANIGKLDGWLLSQSHDAHKISKTDKQDWINSTISRLDLSKTLRDVTAAEREATLGRMYEHFATGEHIVTRNPDATGFKGVGNIGKSMSHQRVLHFKTPQDAAAYHREFGHGTMVDGIVAGIRQSAGKTAIMSHLGPNARENYNAVVDRLRVKARDEGQLTRFTKKAKEMESLYWPFLDGSANVPGNKTFANVMGGVRAAEVMAKLGMATISAFSDPAFFAAEIARQGGGYFGGMAEALGGVFKGKSVEKNRILSEMGVVLDGLVGTASAKFDVAEPTSGFISKLTQNYFKLNALQQWTDRQRTAFALGMAHRLGNTTTKPYASMDPEMREILSLYDINEAEWSAISKSELSTAEGRSYLTSEGVKSLDKTVIHDYLTSKGETNITELAITEARDALGEKLRVAYADRMSHAVVQGDLKTKGMLLRGSQVGTLGGEAARSFALFKSFSVAVLQKVVGADLYGRSSATTFNGAAKDAWSNGGASAIVRTVLSSAMLGYVSMSVKDMLKGKQPRDPLSTKTVAASFLQGGGLGLYGDFLFGDLRNRFGGSALSSFMGPVFGSAANVVDLLDRVKAGDDSAAAAFRLLVNHTPYANLFWTKLPLDYAITWQMSESMNPGWAARNERRNMTQNAQEYIPMFSPTAAVR